MLEVMDKKCTSDRIFGKFESTGGQGRMQRRRHEFLRDLNLKGYPWRKKFHHRREIY